MPWIFGFRKQIYGEFEKAIQQQFFQAAK